jgi:hypothetical protein
MVEAIRLMRAQRGKPPSRRSTSRGLTTTLEGIGWSRSRPRVGGLPIWFGGPLRARLAAGWASLGGRLAREPDHRRGQRRRSLDGHRALSRRPGAGRDPPSAAIGVQQSMVARRPPPQKPEGTRRFYADHDPPRPAPRRGELKTMGFASAALNATANLASPAPRSVPAIIDSLRPRSIPKLSATPWAEPRRFPPRFAAEGEARDALAPPRARSTERTSPPLATASLSSVFHRRQREAGGDERGWGPGWGRLTRSPRTAEWRRDPSRVGTPRPRSKPQTVVGQSPPPNLTHPAPAARLPPPSPHAREPTCQASLEQELGQLLRHAEHAGSGRCPSSV